MRDRRRKYLPSPLPDPERMVKAGYLLSVGDVADLTEYSRETARKWILEEWWTADPVAFTRGGVLYYLPDVLDCLESHGKMDRNRREEIES